MNPDAAEAWIRAGSLTIGPAIALFFAIRFISNLQSINAERVNAELKNLRTDRDATRADLMAERETSRGLRMRIAVLEGRLRAAGLDAT